MKNMIILMALGLLSACKVSDNSGVNSYTPGASGGNTMGVSVPNMVYVTPNYVDPEILVDNYAYFGRWEFDQSIASSITAVSYDYHVYLPPEYDLEPERSFPIVYVTDAQYDVSFQAKVIDVESRPLIMVGITEGPPGRRATDYILPGARTYFRFFTEEFVPRVESQYRVVASNRTFEGSSAGGMASLVMAFMDNENPPIFKHHFIFDPYINVSALNDLIDERIATHVPFAKTFFINSMSGGFTSTVVPFVTTLRDREIDKLVVHERIYDYGHTDATWVSFSLALSLAFGNRE